MVWRIIERFNVINDQEDLDKAINDASIKTQSVNLITRLTNYHLYVPNDYSKCAKRASTDGKLAIPSKRQKQLSDAINPVSS